MLSPVPLSRTGKKKEEEIRGGPPALVGTREYKQSVAGGGWFRVLWNLECPIGLSHICALFSVGNLVQLGRSAKINSGAT